MKIEGLEIKNDREIIVPRGIRFISDWKEYSLGLFQFPHILDKKIPGCGYTEYCIKTFLPIILCSPRKILLENKTEQHPEVFYFRNESDVEIETDKDLTKITVSSGIEEVISDEIKSREKEIYEICLNLFDKYYENLPIRKVSLTFGRLTEDNSIQLNLFDSFEDVKKVKKENKAIDEIKKKYGNNSILKASSLLDDSTIMDRNGKIGGHNAG